MNELEAVLLKAKSYIGYKEKKSEKDLEDFNKNIGANNYTIFAKIFEKATGLNYQGQYWCDLFIDSIFIECFGVERARELLGGFSAYTPTSFNNFKRMGRLLKKNEKPMRGDIIFFKNEKRINHTGIVDEIYDYGLASVEGNTSPQSGIIENGGEVALKKYFFNNPRIAGYARPNYSIDDWTKKDNGWIFYYKGKQVFDKFIEYNGLIYYLDVNGFLVTGQFFKNGKRYYSDENGRIYRTNDHGRTILHENIDWFKWKCSS